ncbi:MAG: FMN-binding protein [Candidatus Dojkabacteria bacterium]|nr:FMN-binding protein [Candidatus Dojkabacteria bacterium]
MNNKNNLIISGLIIGTSLIIVSAGIIFWNSRTSSNESAGGDVTDQPTTHTTNNDTTCTENDRCFVPSDINTTVTNQTSTYKNGSYTTEVAYSVPDGFNKLKLSIKLENGKITEVNVTQSDIDSESKKYDRRFQSNYKSFVINQDIDNLRLDVVSGASLTTDAFNNALEKIRQQAKS